LISKKRLVNGIILALLAIFVYVFLAGKAENHIDSLFMDSGRSVILDIPVDVSQVGEKFGKSIEIPYTGSYLIKPVISNYKEIPTFDDLSKNEKLIEMGNNITLEIVFTCNGGDINLKTQKLSSGVISGFGVPKDIPKGQCEHLSVYIQEADPSFSKRRGDLNIVIQRLAK
jgi:hypothetical protein